MKDGVAFKIPVYLDKLAPLRLHKGDLVAIDLDDIRGIFRVDALVAGKLLVTQQEFPEISNDVFDLEFLRHR